MGPGVAALDRITRAKAVPSDTDWTAGRSPHGPSRLRPYVIASGTRQSIESLFQYRSGPVRWVCFQDEMDLGERPRMLFHEAGMQTIMGGSTCFSVGTGKTDLEDMNRGAIGFTRPEQREPNAGPR